MSAPDTGVGRRDVGAARTQAAATAAHRITYRDHAEAAIAAFIRENYAFTADDIHDEIPDGIEPHSPNLLPAVILTAARQHLIRQVGWRRSTRPSRHASMLRVWKGTAHD